MHLFIYLFYTGGLKAPNRIGTLINFVFQPMKMFSFFFRPQNNPRKVKMAAPDDDCRNQAAPGAYWPQGQSYLRGFNAFFTGDVYAVVEEQAEALMSAYAIQLSLATQVGLSKRNKPEHLPLSTNLLGT